MQKLKARARSRRRMVALFGAIVLGVIALSAVNPFSYQIYFLFSGLVGLLRIIPVYGTFILAMSLLRRRVLVPPRAPGSAARRAWILAMPAFTPIAWIGVQAYASSSLMDPTIGYAAAFVLYAHSARLVVKTGRGERALGVGSLGLGGLILLTVTTSLFWSQTRALCGFLEDLTFPYSRIGMGLYGGILAWNGTWLWRAKQDKA